LIFGLGPVTAEMRVLVPVLSTGTQTYIVRVGFLDSTAPTAPSNGVYFEYSSAASANWRCVTMLGGTSVPIDSGVAVAANTYYRLGIVINASGTSAQFFINGTLIGTSAVNIPVAVANVCGPTIFMHKTVGGTSRSLNVDYFTYHYVFNNYLTR
jgi:hypothetical protein